MFYEIMIRKTRNRSKLRLWYHVPNHAHISRSINAVSAFYHCLLAYGVVSVNSNRVHVYKNL